MTKMRRSCQAGTRAVQYRLFRHEECAWDVVARRNSLGIESDVITSERKARSEFSVGYGKNLSMSGPALPGPARPGTTLAGRSALSRAVGALRMRRL